MRAMAHDLKFALRRLRRAPLFTAFAVITLSLSIGVVTAAYSLVRAGLQLDLGLNDPGRLVLVAKSSAATGGLYSVQLSWPDYQDVIAQTQALDRVAAWTIFTNALVARGRSEFTTGDLVSGNYFETIGVRALRGRLIDATDDKPGATPVVVLSASVWKSRFARDPDVIGSPVKIGGHQFEVIGIAPEAFRGLRRRGGFGQTEAWVPLSMAPSLAARWSQQDPSRRNQPWLSVVGRLASGRTKSDANAEFRLMADRIDAAAPLPDRPLVAGGSVPQKREWQALGVDAGVSLSEARDVFRVVLMLPALVLIVACTNIANFALSRGLTRRSEFGIRLAIGASRWQLIRGQLAEYSIVAALGGVGGLVVANGLLVFVTTTIRTMFGDVPQYRIDAPIDGAVILAVGLDALLALLVAGLIPAIQLTRQTLRQAMASDEASTPMQRWRGRSNLIALQVGVSVALLMVVALCVRQLPKLNERMRTGMELERVAVVNVPFLTQSMSEQSVRQTIDGVLGALRGLPGAATAAASSDRKFSSVAEVTPEGHAFAVRSQKSPTARELSVSPGYFQTVGLRLIAGRPFDDRDSAGAERVAVLNETQAKSLFGTTNAVGRRLLTRESGDPNAAVSTLTIVGIAEDTRLVTTKGESIDAMLYRPIAQRFEDTVPIQILAAATEGTDPAQLAGLAREALRRVNPDVAVAFVGRADAEELGPQVVMRYFVLGFGSLAFLALVFAMSGLYGVLTHVVARRTRELGVRAALGAEPVRLVRLVMKDGSRPVLEGIVLGFGLAAGARLGMQPWFTEPVTAIDPVALVIALVPLAIAAAIACYLPARRAARADPNVALRHL